MAVARNAEPIQFNGGAVLSSPWPSGATGQSEGTITHFTLWPSEHGGAFLISSPFSRPVAAPRGRPVRFPAQILQVVVPHGTTAARWHDGDSTTRGESTLQGAYLMLEALIAKGETLGANPVRGRVHVGLHRPETRTSTSAQRLPADFDVIYLTDVFDIAVRSYLRVTGNPGGADEIVRIVERITSTSFGISRGEDGIDGSPTTAATHDAGNLVTILEAPSAANELVNAGIALPASPTAGQRFVFSAAATGLTGAVDADGQSVSAASADDFFIYDVTNWVRQSQGQGVLRNFGATGYSRVEIVRDPLMQDGAPLSYTGAISSESNGSGWLLSRR